MITLVSCDNKEFQLETSLAYMSATIKDYYGGLPDEQPGDTPPMFQLPDVTGETLEKVIHFLKNNSLDGINVDHETMFSLILASNYLAIPTLLEVTCRMMAALIKGKTPDEIRATFNIEEDFTDEEKEQIRMENEWCKLGPVES